MVLERKIFNYLNFKNQGLWQNKQSPQRLKTKQ